MSFQYFPYDSMDLLVGCSALMGWSGMALFKVQLFLCDSLFIETSELLDRIGFFLLLFESGSFAANNGSLVFLGLLISSGWI